MTSKLNFTPVEDISKIKDSARAAYVTGKSRDIAFRKEQLLQIAYMMEDNQQAWRDALKADLGRPALEADMLEIGAMIGAAIHAHDHVAGWAATTHVRGFNPNNYVLRPRIRKDPKGVVLIIGPFNYPLWCLIGPLICAVAAGNAVVLKPSELASNVAITVAELIPKYLDKSLYYVVNGGVPETTKLLELHWDHIMYTGGTGVGKIVAAAAAKNLTPCTLELGGKSPVVVDPDANMDLVARRVLWGKTVNAGQTCTAPDYILVPESAQQKLVAAFEKAYNDFYPHGAEKSESFSRIVAPHHWDRIMGLVETTKGTIVNGGKGDRATKFIEPTIVRDVKTTDSLMSMEIFGPVLPIVPVSTIDAAVDYINSCPPPLILYVMTENANLRESVFDRTQSGMASSNETILNASVPELPFGGIGNSGYGASVGENGFNTFTHFRGGIDAMSLTDMALSARYPPYSVKKHKSMNKQGFPKIPYPRPGTHGSAFGFVARILHSVGLY